MKKINLILFVFVILLTNSTFAQQYKSYKGLTMAGYQGWFSAEGDESNRGWYHYKGKNGFSPENTGVDLWPDMNEYKKKYITPFSLKNGSPAYLYSPYDYESVDLHFKWMKEYGIDGVFMQRFVAEIKNPKGKRHFNKVLDNALKAAKKYKRAICIMYDLSGCNHDDMKFIIEDWKELESIYSLSNVKKNPTYLYHNQKPLLALWGVGFNDKRKYSVSEISKLIQDIQGNDKKNSILLGVPYYWRTQKKDTSEDPDLHNLIRSVDIIMPWAVGRYDSKSYSTKIALTDDIKWCKENKVDYAPLVFPGFSWGNLQNDTTIYNKTPREKGDFLWKQVVGAKNSGAEMLYIAMFDEIDEGTAIYKCAREKDLPLNGRRRFVGIENDLDSDYYLWLVGKAAEWFRGEKEYGTEKPIRK